MIMREAMESIARTAILLLCYLVTASVSAQDEPVRPLPMPENLDQRKVALGERLFHDVRLSADDTISCASCHVLATGGADNRQISTGIRGAQGELNSPTVFNSVYNFRQFWDGRADSLEKQVDGPIHNPVEMGANWPMLEYKLKAVPELAELFDQIYADGITENNIIDSIVEFERSLVTLNSPVDEWLRGNESALSELEIEGYQLFKSYGCIACHQGRNVGSNMYAQMGEMGDYFADRGKAETTADLGRFNITGKEWDKHYFKVPSLRLAARTPPYFHDGSVDTLEEAVLLMARYQLGRSIPDSDLKAIVAFLYALEGIHPALVPNQ